MISEDEVSFTPFQFGIFPPCQLFESQVDICGLSVSACAVGSEKVYGLSASGLATGMKEICGIAVSGLATLSDYNNGLMVSGIINLSRENRGLSISLINYTSDNRGSSGLISIIKDSYIPFMPIVNFAIPSDTEDKDSEDK